MGLRLGQPADLTLIDPQDEFTVQAKSFQSKSRNTPFDGWRLKGRAILTLADGRIVHALDAEKAAF